MKSPLIPSAENSRKDFAKRKKSAGSGESLGPHDRGFFFALNNSLFVASITKTRLKLTSGEDLVLRSLIAADAHHLALFMKSVLSDGSGMVAVAGEVPEDVATQSQIIQALESDPSAVTVSLFHDGSLVAHLDFKPYARQRLRHGGEFGISVAPKWRGKGLGRILMTHFIAWAECAPIHKINLRVRADNTGAIKLYGEFGFQQQGRFPKEVKLEDGTYVDDISMYRLV